jgi:hypothetical protein
VFIGHHPQSKGFIMTIFHLDILIYILFVIVNVYNNMNQLKKDFFESAIYFSIFAFCIFVILIAMMKAFPVAMFFFLCFALLNATRQLLGK